jgi:hypothetical protein
MNIGVKVVQVMMDHVSMQKVDLDQPMLMDVLDDVYGSDLRDVRSLKLARRRPDLYGRITAQGTDESR